MIHLKKVSTVFSKSVQNSHKFPHSTSKLLRGLLRAECKSSVNQLIRFLNKEGLKESTINAEDTTREVRKILSNFSISTENVDEDTLTEKVINADADSTFVLNGDTSIETFRKFVKEADIKKVNVAWSIIRYLWGFLKSNYFPLQNLCKHSDVNSFFSVNEFQEVFETVETNLRCLTNRELLIVFDVCTIFKVSANSSLMQKVIKLLSSNINSMSTLNVLHIYCLIKMHYFEVNPQISALSVACRELLDNCLESNFSPNSNPRLMSLYVALEYLPKPVREFLLMKIFQIKPDLPLSSYSAILKGLLLPGVFKLYPKFHKDYIDYILKKVQESLDGDYPTFSLFYFLKPYSNAVRKGLIAYDESFFDLLALQFVKWKPPLPVAVESCRRFFRAGHFNAAFFDYIATEATKLLNSDQLGTLKDTDFYFLTEVLSTAGKQHTKILNYFYRERLIAWSNFPTFENYLRILLPLNLAVLGIYEDRLIENCFTSKNGGELTEDDFEGLNDSNLNSLLLLHQAVVTFHPSYSKPLLSEELMKKLSERNFMVNSKSRTWLETVQLCFGGSNFVMKNCTTPLHHNLSYVVVLDKNNVPIDVESIQKSIYTRTTDERFNIGDIPASEETQVIVFQEVWPQSQVGFRNVSSWRGTFQLYIDVLEVYCNGVIPLLSSDFASLQEFERVPFLLNKIEKKIGVIGKPVSSESESDK